MYELQKQVEEKDIYIAHLTRKLQAKDQSGSVTKHQQFTSGKLY